MAHYYNSFFSKTQALTVVGIIVANTFWLIDKKIFMKKNQTCEIDKKKPLKS